MNDAQFEQVIHKMQPQSKLLRAWKLTGGISAQVTALEVEKADGSTQKMVVRVHGDVDFNKNTNVARDEFTILQILHSAGIAAPQPYFLDQSDTIFGRPYLVTEFIEGTTDFAPSRVEDALGEMAVQLARIHSIDGTRRDLDFLPSYYSQMVTQRPAVLDDSLQEGRIRDVVEKAWPFEQHNPSTLLHGDFWPGNVMWRDGQFQAVIDWEDVLVGDPLRDLCTVRLELLWGYGADGMNSFTQRYLSLNPVDARVLPYWDLYAALRPASKLSIWASDAAAEAHMRAGHAEFVAQAFEKLNI